MEQEELKWLGMESDKGSITRAITWWSITALITFLVAYSLGKRYYQKEDYIAKKQRGLV